MLTNEFKDVFTLEKVKIFALDKLQTILPNGFKGKFFLAGGCFKTLLHGKPPNDLDLWPATDHDRIQLLEALFLQGNDYNIKFSRQVAL